MSWRQGAGSSDVAKFKVSDVGHRKIPSANVGAAYSTVIEMIALLGATVAATYS
jgi:hypothetical protein